MNKLNVITRLRPVSDMNTSFFRGVGYVVPTPLKKRRIGVYVGIRQLHLHL